MRYLRYGVLLGGAVALLLAVGYFFSLPWATGTWPFAAGRFTHMFVSAMLGAIGCAAIWTALAEDWGALAGGALNLFVMFGGMALFLVITYNQIDEASLLTFAVIYAVIALANLVFLFLGRNLPARDVRTVPSLVRISFALFTVVLLLAGISLIVPVPDIISWPVTPQLSVMIGIIFCADACYFIYGLLHPNWTNARGQLVAFLAYDLVLIVPLLVHFADVPPQHLLGLIIYVLVVVYSGALSAYYLLINKDTRLNIMPQSVQVSPSDLL